MTVCEKHTQFERSKNLHFYCHIQLSLAQMGRQWFLLTRSSSFFACEFVCLLVFSTHTHKNIHTKTYTKHTQQNIHKTYTHDNHHNNISKSKYSYLELSLPALPNQQSQNVLPSWRRRFRLLSSS